MRACEGCRKRKIKCDAATTNTWPCSACIRLKLHCVRPNGYEGSDTNSTYDTMLDASGQFQQMSMPGQSSQDGSKPMPDLYDGSFSDRGQTSFQQVSFDTTQGQHNLHYTTVPAPGVLDATYSGPNAFPTPPMHPGPRQESSPEAQSIDSYQQQDLADLLGGLKVNELGTGRFPHVPFVRYHLTFEQHHIYETKPHFGEKNSQLWKTMMITVQSCRTFP